MTRRKQQEPDDPGTPITNTPTAGRPKPKKQKRRGKGEGTVYQRKSDNRWVAEITLEDGTRKPLYGKTQEEVIAKLKEAQYQLRQGTLATGPRQKLGDHLNWWLEEVRKMKLRPGSYARYRIVLDTHILPRLGHIQLQKLTLQKIQSFYNEKYKEGHSASAIHIMRNILSKGLDYAVQARMISYNPCKGATLPPLERRKVQPLTLEQAQHLLTVAKGHSLEAMLAVAISTGMRHGELAALRWEDVNFDEGSLYIHRTVTRMPRLKYVEGDPKTKTSERTIPLAPAVCDILKAHRARQNEERLKAGAAWQNKDLVFCAHGGGFLDPNHVRVRFYQLLEKAGLPRMRIHDLRHTASNLFRSMGVDIKEVQEMLGHSTLDTTANVYSQVLPHMRKEASEKINRLFQ